MKLGKLAARYDDRTLLLASYLTPKLPTPPESMSLATKVMVPWGDMGNSDVGDCTCAAAGHLIMEWTANAEGVAAVPTTEQILSAYSAITGYDPADPSTDNGAVELDVLKYWRSTGIAGHRIGAFVALEPKNHVHIMDAVFIFGGVYIGLELPLSAQDQHVWSVPSQGPHGQGEPGSWGGHAVPIVGYSPRGLYCVTWGELRRLTWGFWQTYCSEAYAILSPDFVHAGRTPTGFDVAALQADLKAIR